MELTFSRLPKDLVGISFDEEGYRIRIRSGGQEIWNEYVSASQQIRPIIEMAITQKKLDGHPRLRRYLAKALEAADELVRQEEQAQPRRDPAHAEMLRQGFTPTDVPGVWKKDGRHAITTEFLTFIAKMPELADFLKSGGSPGVKTETAETLGAVTGIAEVLAESLMKVSKSAIDMVADAATAQLRRVGAKERQRAGQRDRRLSRMLSKLSRHIQSLNQIEVGLDHTRNDMDDALSQATGVLLMANETLSQLMERLEAAVAKIEAATAAPEQESRRLEHLLNAMERLREGGEAALAQLREATAFTADASKNT